MIYFWSVTFLMMTVAGVKERSISYTDYRFEKLCPIDSSKVQLKLDDSPASFHLNSSLIPGGHFTCHLELSLQPNFGFLVYFDSMNFAKPTDGVCEEDYVQFGRDVLFITSHRSPKYCGVIEGSMFVPMKLHPGNITVSQGGKEALKVTPLSKRVYSESSDQEMDLWVQLWVPPPDHPDHKTVSITVTPVKKSCSTKDKKLRRCSKTSPECISKELFCDGRVNCVTETNIIQDETGCNLTSTPPSTDSTHWKVTEFPYVKGLFCCLFILSVVLCCIKKKFPRKTWKHYSSDRPEPPTLGVHDCPPSAPAPMDRHNVTRGAAPPPPPSYSESEDRDRIWAPGYSYSNR